MKKDIVNISIRQIIITAVILSSCLSLMAQNESDSIHISTDFLNELDNTSIVNIPGLSNGEFAKGIVAWRSKKNPDLMILNTGNGFVTSGLDVNAFLSQYLTKEGRTLRKSRDLAESCKDIMDKFFPISGSALFSKDDSVTLTNKRNDK